MNFDATSQQLIMYSAFFKYLREKNGNKIKQCISYLFTSRKLIIQLGWGLVQYSYGVWYAHETGKVIKICLNKIYSRVLVGMHLSDMFPIENCFKQGDALSPLLFNFV